MALGDGSAFKRMVTKFKKQHGISDPAALAASIGRKKYGEKKMAKWSAEGKKKA